MRSCWWRKWWCRQSLTGCSITITTAIIIIIIIITTYTTTVVADGGGGGGIIATSSGSSNEITAFYLFWFRLLDETTFSAAVIFSEARAVNHRILSTVFEIVMWRSCWKFAFVECEFQLPKFVEFECGCECCLIKVYFITRNATHWFMPIKWMWQYSN